MTPSVHNAACARYILAPTTNHPEDHYTAKKNFESGHHAPVTGEASFYHVLWERT